MERLFGEFTLVTQNVDNLHQRAGSRKVLELHGNLERSYCIECHRPANDATVGEDVEVPRCSFCGGMLRPDVVWFGEMLPQRTFMEAAWSAEHCDVFITIGTSGIVYPAAWLPINAREAGAYVVEVNTEYTDLSPRMSETVIGKAAAVLPELVRVLQHQN
jgi:NAD-dependent deacetylase